MRFTALPPPPPTPTTFIRAVWTPLSSSSNLMVCSPRPDSEEVLEPPFHRSEHLLDGRRLPATGAEAATRCHLPGAVQNQYRGYRHSRRFDAVRETSEALAGNAAAGRHGEDLPGQFHDARGQRPTARQDNPCRKSLMIACASDLVERILQYFLQSHVHDMRQHTALGIARPLAGRARQLEDVALGHQRLEPAAVALLEALRIQLGHLESVHDVRGHVSAGAQQ